MSAEEYSKIYDSTVGLKPEERSVAVVSTFMVELGEKGKSATAGEILDAMVRVYATIMIDDTRKLEIKSKAKNGYSNAAPVEAKKTTGQEENPVYAALMQSEKHYMFPNQLAKALATTEDVIKNLAKPLIDQKIIYQKNDPEKPYYAFTAEFKKKIGMK